MPMLEVKNREYQDRMQAAIWAAIIETARDPETNTAPLLSGEIVQACLNTIALMAGTSEVSASSTSLREFGEECGKAIRARTGQIRRLHEAGQGPFATVIHAGDRH